MGRGSVSSKFLVILNIIYPMLGVAIIGLSTYFFLNILSLTNLRNPNHFIVDTKFYWTQALPWIFVISGVFVILVSCCAFMGVLKKSRPLVLTNATFQLLTILLLAASATMSIKYADSKDTYSFVNETISDAFYNMRTTNKAAVDKAYQTMEVNLQCCGSTGPSSYTEFDGRWQWEYAVSCCQTYHGEPIDKCSKTNPAASTRKGCIDVAVYYTRIAVKILAAAAIFTGFIGILNLATALIFTNGLNNRKKIMKAKLLHSDSEAHRSHASTADMETLKMPLKV